MKRLLPIFSLMLVCLTMLGQGFSTDTVTTRYALHSVYFSPEKLYLHIDRTAYAAGETIWFNGYLRNATAERQDAESNYIYVELACPNGSVERRIKVKRSGSSFPGYMFLPEDLEKGQYILKAYTLSQLDMPQEYYFHQELTIIGPEPENPKKDRKAKAPKTDVSFYPEGGRYFAGTPSMIGVKAMDSEGRNLHLKGMVMDDEGKQAASFETTHDGMGLIRFIPEEGRHFVLETEDGARYPLPDPSSEGASISTTLLPGRVMVRINGAGQGQYKLLLRDISAMREIGSLQLEGASRTLMIPREYLSEGINHLILMDAKGRTVSERLFFEYGTQAPQAQLSGSTQGLGNRDATSVELRLTAADGSPLDGSCSIAVTGASLASYRQDDGIDSFMMLTSELRGTISDPRWYFDPAIPEKERASALDLLMMIQGWSYYDMATIADPKVALDTRKHGREFTQFIRGKVERSFSGKAPTNFMMTILFPSLDMSRIVPVSQGKRFILDSLSFEEGNGVMIKISRESGKLDYIPSWEGEEFAPDFAYALKTLTAWKDSTGFPLDYVSADTLNAAIVSAESSGNFLGINGHALPKDDYKMYGNQTLLQYLMIKAPNFRFDGELMHNSRTAMLDGYGEHNGGDNMWDESPVQLVVDGTVEPWVGFENLLVDDIESIVISYEPDIIYRAREGVVAIKLQYGTRVTHLSDTEPSLIYFTPLGYQTPQKFYAPRYDLGFSSGEADKRNTLFWDPQVKVSGGKAKITFCTDDSGNYPYMISVEGISSDGKPFSASAML